MRLVGSLLIAGGFLTWFSWPSDGIGFASMFIVACGLLFLGWDGRPEFDDLERERLGL